MLLTISGSHYAKLDIKNSAFYETMDIFTLVGQHKLSFDFLTSYVDQFQIVDGPLDFAIHEISADYSYAQLLDVT